VQTQRYTITVETNERRISNLHDSQSQHTHQSSAVETFTRVKVVDQSAFPTILTAYLRRVEEHSGFTFVNPSISVGKMLPDDSLVFTVVVRGDVDQLKCLLARRQCTLRDRDARGTPLLHVRKSENVQATPDLPYTASMR